MLAGAFPASAQVVVLAHPPSGDFVVVQNRPSPRTEAMQRANAKRRGAGWTLLLNSTAPGYGAMFCFRSQGGDVRYFIAEGKATGKEAIIAARMEANAAAAGTGAFTSICGNWHNLNTYPLEAQPGLPATRQAADRSSGMTPGDAGPRKEGERGLIELIKHQVRDHVACDPKQQPGGCPETSPSRFKQAAGVRG